MSGIGHAERPVSDLALVVQASRSTGTSAVTLAAEVHNSSTAIGLRSEFRDLGADQRHVESQADGPHTFGPEAHGDLPILLHHLVELPCLREMLGEVRGKVVMLSRFGGDGSGWENGLEGLGIHPTAWPDSEKAGFTWRLKGTLVRTHDW